MTGDDDTTDDERPDAHLAALDDGCGCAEVWAHTSARRRAGAAADSTGPDE